MDNGQQTTDNGQMRRIAYLSPLNPAPSGISDYSEDVAGGFSRVVYHVASSAIPPALGLLLTPEKLGSLGQPVIRAKAKEMERQFAEKLRAAFAERTAEAAR